MEMARRSEPLAVWDDPGCSVARSGTILQRYVEVADESDVGLMAWQIDRLGEREVLCTEQATATANSTIVPSNPIIGNARTPAEVLGTNARAVRLHGLDFSLETGKHCASDRAEARCCTRLGHLRLPRQRTIWPPLPREHIGSMPPDTDAEA